MGLKVRLTGQPFQILVILLERPGELVTREEVQKRLWPGGTFVDFDRGLNAAVNRVREALGDSAENPRFVETLPRRGYRFIGHVEGPHQQVRPNPSQLQTASETESRAAVGKLESQPDQ
jgi:cholera toxin transcriptional activator